MKQANNSRQSCTVVSTDYMVYKTGKIEATLARSREFKKSLSGKAELKSISTLTLSHERAYSNSGTFLAKVLNLSHLNYSTKLSTTSSSNTATKSLTQTMVSILLLLFTCYFNAFI